MRHPERSGAAGGSYKVALIDDDQAVRESLQFLLELTGHVVEAFASAPAFLQVEASEFACLITDHHMPEMTGLELIKRLRAEGVRIPVLLITADPSPAMAATAASHGVARIMAKPLPEQDLLDFVNTMVSQGGQSAT